MKRLWVRVVLLAVLLATLVMPSLAQEITFGLSTEDFAALGEALTNGVTSNSYAFDYSADLTIDGAPIAEISGRGQLDVAGEMLGITLTGNAAGLPIDAELRIVGEFFYVQVVDPSTGEPSGWFSVPLDELGQLDPAFLTDAFAQGTGGDFTVDDLGEALEPLLTANPEDFITITRNGNDFVLEVLFTRFADSPQFTAIVENLAAQAGGDPQDGIAELRSLVSGLSLTVTETIDPATSLATSNRIDFSGNFDSEALAEAGLPAALSFSQTVTVDYNATISVEAPADAVPFPMDSFLSGMGVEPPVDADSTGSASNGSAVSLACFDNAISLAGEPGTSATVTCPSNCASEGGTVWGTNMYTDDSAVCTAAVHAGALTNEGGTTTVLIKDGQDAYPASLQNDVQSSEWGSWNRSFTFDGLAASTSNSSSTDSPSVASTGAFANVHRFPNGVSFSYPDGFTVQSPTEQFVLLQDSDFNVLQVYELASLFSAMPNLTSDFIKETYLANLAAFGVTATVDDYVDVEVNGRTISVLEFDGASGGTPVIGLMAVVPYTNGGFGYALAYAVKPEPTTFMADMLAVAGSLDN